MPTTLRERGRQTDRQTGRQTDRQRQRCREIERDRGRDRDRENSELRTLLLKDRDFRYCLFLHSVLANLHANTYTTTVRALTTIITLMKMIMTIYW